MKLKQQNIESNLNSKENGKHYNHCKYDSDTTYDYIANDIKLRNESLREKCSNTEFFLVRIFPVFGLNTEILGVFSIWSEYTRLRTRRNPVFGHFSW